jgi:hypothetical protein
MESKEDMEARLINKAILSKKKAVVSVYTDVKSFLIY